jgi:hypothetical protein
LKKGVVMAHRKKSQRVQYGPYALPPLGGNQNIGYQPVSEYGAFVTGGGPGEPTGSVFGTYQPDFGYVDDSPFTSHVVNATGNMPLLANQSTTPLQTPFGSMAGTPQLTQNPGEGMQTQQPVPPGIDWMKWALVIGGGVLAIYLITKSRVGV